jgi:hypothetical protein
MGALRRAHERLGAAEARAAESAAAAREAAEYRSGWEAWLRSQAGEEGMGGMLRPEGRVRRRRRR